MSDIKNNSDTIFSKVSASKNYENIRAEDLDAGNYDYIIVGAGSAGCVIARRLLDHTDARVLVVEAGGSAAGVASIETPARWPENLFTAFDYAYQYETSPLVNNRPIALNRGKMLGGSGSLNFMAWARGNKYDYDGWAAAGNEGWDYESVLPLFKKIEDWEDGETDFHGAGGPIRVERSKNVPLSLTSFIEGAKSYGMPFLEDVNGASPEGVGLGIMNVKDGLRSSPYKGYLEPVITNDRLTLLTYAQVLKLNFEGTRCVGLDFVQNDKTYSVRASKEVILSAGAIDTPRILMLSGLGDAKDLRALGIDPLLNLWGVGKNLQDHVILQGLCFESKEPLPAPNNNLAGGTAHWKSQPELQASDLMFMGIQGPAMMPELAQKYPPRENCFSIVPSLINVKSRGYLKMKTSRHDSPLEIQPNFLADPADLSALVRAVEISMDIASQPVFKNFIKGFITPSKFNNRQEIIDFVRDATNSYLHPGGTCAMGPGEESVVNAQLLVHGTQGLRIADASIMPKITTCNTHAPVIMIAEFAAQLILGK